MSAERYAEVNAPHVWPPISRAEGIKVAGLLRRRFGRKADASENVQHDMKGLPYAREGRRCWISLKPHTGLDKGWPRLIHDVSHMVFAYRHPRFRSHEVGHHKLEREMRDWAIAWLAAKPAPKGKPGKRELLVERAVRVEELLAGWRTKQKRAGTAIDKLLRERKAIDKKLGELALSASVREIGEIVEKIDAMVPA